MTQLMTMPGPPCCLKEMLAVAKSISNICRISCFDLQVRTGSYAFVSRCQTLIREAGLAVLHGSAEPQSKSGSRAIVIGGGLAGLASARVLSDLFDEVVLLERDAITQQASCSIPLCWLV